MSDEQKNAFTIGSDEEDTVPPSQQASDLQTRITGAVPETTESLTSSFYAATTQDLFGSSSLELDTSGELKPKHVFWCDVFFLKMVAYFAASGCVSFVPGCCAGQGATIPASPS